MKIVGKTNDVTTCELCGKSCLKCTVVLMSEDGNCVYYGRDCAAKTLYGKNTNAYRIMAENLGAAIEYAKRLFAENKNGEQVRKAIWNRYGYLFNGHTETSVTFEGVTVTKDGAK